MQDYGDTFAKVYDEEWSGFSERFAPAFLDFLGDRGDRTLLDLCCGTGRLALRFLERGWKVTALDRSEAMLGRVRGNAAGWSLDGSLTIVRADAASFALPRRHAAALSLYDALNHLPDKAALAGCFR